MKLSFKAVLLIFLLICAGRFIGAVVIKAGTSGTRALEEHLELLNPEKKATIRNIANGEYRFW